MRPEEDERTQQWMNVTHDWNKSHPRPRYSAI